MLSRKTYQAVAGIVRKAREIPAPKLEGISGESAWLNGAEITSDDIAASLAEYFAVDNPRFDRERFLEACGVQQ